MNIFKYLGSKIATLVGKINWNTKNNLSDRDFAKLRELLKNDYYIILTRHDGHLSTYAISLAHWVLTRGKKGYYGHVLMNLENTVIDDSSYRFIEATGTGVHYSDFNQAFDLQTSSVALLKPRSMSIDEWTSALDKAKTAIGKPYDTLFDLANDNQMSCVELVRFALQGNPNYAEDFKHFEAMILKNKNLDPQMFYECSDFEIVWEQRPK